MARFQKLNAIADKMMARMDELGDDAIQAMRNTPEAKARQAELAAKLSKSSIRREAVRQSAIKTSAEAAASTWKVGQNVRTRRGEIGQITAIEGTLLAVTISGAARKFNAAMVQAA